MSDMTDVVREAYNCVIARDGTSLKEGLEQYDGYFVVITVDGHLYSERECRYPTEHADVFRTELIAEKEASQRIASGFEVKKIGQRMRAGLEKYLTRKQADYHPTR